MNAQLDKDAHGAFWFFTASDNRLAAGGPAMAQFAAKGHELFACISGTLVSESDRTVLDKLWSNSIAAWYEGGKDDPKLVLLRFDLDDAEIWTRSEEHTYELQSLMRNSYASYCFKK